MRKANVDHSKQGNSDQIGQYLHTAPSMPRNRGVINGNRLDQEESDEEVTEHMEEDYREESEDVQELAADPAAQKSKFLFQRVKT